LNKNVSTTKYAKFAFNCLALNDSSASIPIQSDAKLEFHPITYYIKYLNSLFIDYHP